MKQVDRLAAGLEAQDWRETASRGPWRRFGKFGRGAMYVMLKETHGCAEGSLWFSQLHLFVPDDEVVGPIKEQILLAGDKLLAQARPDTEGLLIELLYNNGGSDATRSSKDKNG